MKKEWTNPKHRCHCGAERERLVRELRRHVSREIRRTEERILDRIKRLEKDIGGIWRGLAEEG